MKTGRKDSTRTSADRTSRRKAARPSTDLRSSWLDRFNRQFPEFKDSVSPKSQPVWLLYDSMYLAAYAIASLGDKPVTGENLAQVLGRMNGPGNVVTTYYSAGGPNGVSRAIRPGIGASISATPHCVKISQPIRGRIPRTRSGVYI